MHPTSQITVVTIGFGIIHSGQKLKWHPIYFSVFEVKDHLQEGIFLNLTGLHSLDSLHSPIQLQQQESRIIVPQSITIEKRLRIEDRLAFVALKIKEESFLSF